MNKIDKKIDEYIQKLFKTPLFETYFQLKTLIENDENLSRQRKAIALAKKNNEKNYSLLLNEYNSNPLINNFLNVKEEVKIVLEEIKQIIEEDN